jgi:hypothetical protein
MPFLDRLLLIPIHAGVRPLALPMVNFQDLSQVPPTNFRQTIEPIERLRRLRKHRFRLSEFLAATSGRQPDRLLVANSISREG